MSDFLQRLEKLSPKRLALLALEQHDQLEDYAQPIAIVGMSCRFPGGATLDEYWKTLREGRDAVREVPRDRWDIDAYYDPDPDSAGQMSSRWGGFIDNIDQFDAAFFGISRREAVGMDPQQRLILEVAWEALEHAGLAPRSLDGTQTGIFAGLATSDYRHLISSLGQGALDAYSATGSAHSVAAGRLAYVLGLNGPNIAIDTACSSSLVAVHYACQSLRNQECRIALAAGVNAILSPDVTIALSKAHMLAPDGRCKTFDSRADGFVRGEGCGVVVLKRLRDAQTDGDRILAVIRGSAVNQDGRSSGLTAPNGSAQEAVLRQALGAAKVLPHQIQYLETHGTGTSLGDPIEAHALANVLGANRTCPLVIGSVKTNIGHLEAAAGIAGLIKVVLSLQHEWIPAHLHWQQMNPHIDWRGVRVEIPIQGKAWRRNADPRLAGVSSFGFGGTNAHVILEEAPLSSTPAAQPRPWYVLPISARTEAGLEALIAWYRDELQTEHIGSVCFTAAVGRSHFEERIAVIGRSTAEIKENLALERFVRSKPHQKQKPNFTYTPDVAPETIAELYAAGADIDWKELYPHGSLVDLPTYPFQRQRYWIETPASDLRLTRADAAIPIFETEVDLATLAFIRDHRLLGTPIAPASFYIELALEACESFNGASGAAQVEHLNLLEPLKASKNQTRTRLQIVLDDSETNISFRVLSRNTAASGTWTLHAKGSFSGSVSAPTTIDLAELRSRCTDETDPNAFYAALEHLGIELGTSIQGIQQLFSNRRECLAHVILDASFEHEVARYKIHPAFLDSWLQVFGAASWFASGRTSNELRTLSSIDRFTLDRQPDRTVWIHARLDDAGVGSLTVMDESGTRVAQIEGMQLSSRVSNGPVISDLLAELKWVEKPLPQEARTGSILTTAYANQQRELAASLRKRHGLDRYDAFRVKMDQLVSAFIFEAFAKLGVSSEADAACVIPAQRKLFGRLLAILKTDGGEARPAAAIEAGLRSDYPEFEAEIALTSRCGAHLAEVLTGTADVLPLLFPDGTTSSLTSLYVDSPGAKTFNTTIAQIVRDVLAAQPGARFLEIGAGTGGTTTYIAPLLAGTSARYTFTDVSPSFLEPARARFGANSAFDFRTLDVEKDPEGQDFELGSYDVVVASNCLHATADLRETMGHVQRLLAPGGLLILLEGTAPERWVDLTFGMTSGWWRFTDHDLRPDYPLLSRPSWEALLANVGFEACCAIAPTEDSQQTILLARKTRPKRTWLLSGTNDATAGLRDRVEMTGDTVTVAALDQLPELLRQRVIDHVVLFAAADENLSVDPLWREAQTCAAAGSGTKVWLVTVAAQSVANDAVVPANALHWGIGRTVALEHPEIWGGLIDMEKDATPEETAQLLHHHISRFDGEDQIAFRAGRRYAARIERSSALTAAVPSLDANGVYVITGGLGNLGLKVAEWMTAHGARNLVLVGRKGLPETDHWSSISAGTREYRQITAIQKMKDTGAHVTVVAADITQASSVPRLRAALGTRELRGIVHTAAVFENAPLAQVTKTQLSNVIRVKTDGTLLLHELARGTNLDLFVLFSSTTALLGVREMGAYAAGNLYLDAFAHWRRKQGLPALSVNWGLWEELHDVPESDRQNYERAGLVPMRSSDALAALGALLASSTPQAILGRIDWRKLSSVYSLRGRKRILENASETSAPRTTISKYQAPAAPSANALETVRGEAAAVLGLRPDEVDLHMGLFEMGMDSLMSVELKTRLERRFHRNLPNTLTFNYPNVAALANFLAPEAEVIPKKQGGADHTVAEINTVEVSDDLSDDELAGLLSKALEGID